MTEKEKLEKDYKKFNLEIERETENELKKIQEESNALREEVSHIGETAEHLPSKAEPKTTRRKVNT